MPLLSWYDSHARVLPWRENPEPYAVWDLRDHAAADASGGSQAIL